MWALGGEESMPEWLSVQRMRGAGNGGCRRECGWRSSKVLMGQVRRISVWEAA